MHQGTVSAIRDYLVDALAKDEILGSMLYEGPKSNWWGNIAVPTSGSLLWSHLAHFLGAILMRMDRNRHQLSKAL